VFAEIVGTETQLREVLGHPSDRVLAKHVSALDAYCRRFISKSPFVLVASADAKGAVDVSPKGDPPGFVYVMDDRTLVIPERPGNRKADTFLNLLQNNYIGLLFMVPGKPETLRVSGRATIVRDHWLRERLRLNDKTPDFAIAVAIEEVFFHCAKCVIRSQLWTPAGWPDISGLPSLAEAMVAAGRLKETPVQMQALIDQDIRKRLY
jgi:uncharacterized protein